MKIKLSGITPEALWAKIDDLGTQRARVRAAEIDAANCQTSYDWKRLHEEQEKLELLEGEMRDALGI